MDDNTGGAGARANPYAGLRKQIFDFDRGGLGPEADGWTGQVWGVMFETGRSGGTVTFLALADNTTSMYTSVGGGIIGAGFHESVAAANRVLLDVVQAHLAELPLTDQTALPGSGEWIVRAFTDNGIRAVAVAEADFRPGHPLWDVYRAAQDLITQLRLLDEARSTRPPT
jgi:hypothetical protein